MEQKQKRRLAIVLAFVFMASIIGNVYSIAYFVIDAHYDKKIHWVTYEASSKPEVVAANHIMVDDAKTLQEEIPVELAPQEEPLPTTAPAKQAEPSIQYAGATVYVTKSGTKFHRESCSALSKSKIPMPYEEACLTYEPCGKCKP